MRADNLRLIKKNIAFVFNDEIENKQFLNKTRSGIYYAGMSNKDDTAGLPRWGKVVAKAPEVSDYINIGDFVLVEEGMWTQGVTNPEVMDGQKFWITSELKVLATSDEEQFAS